MINLAIHDGKGPITLSDISQCQGISLSYLEQLFAKLRRDGLVEGVRGPGGGYRLAKPAPAISIANIIAAVDEKVDATQCEGRENCQNGERCLTHDLWTSLSDQIFDYLSSINLAEFLSRPSVRAIIERQNDPDEMHVFIAQQS
jgi:Rrf2 family iron-sulfur cluster assembly transcriptional regulator